MIKYKYTQSSNCLGVIIYRYKLKVYNVIYLGCKQTGKCLLLITTRFYELSSSAVQINTYNAPIVSRFKYYSVFLYGDMLNQIKKPY